MNEKQALIAVAEAARAALETFAPWGSSARFQPLADALAALDAATPQEAEIVLPADLYDRETYRGYDTRCLRSGAHYGCRCEAFPRIADHGATTTSRP